MVGRTEYTNRFAVVFIPERSLLTKRATCDWEREEKSRREEKSSSNLSLLAGERVRRIEDCQSEERSCKMKRRIFHSLLRKGKDSPNVRLKRDQMD